jgi:hypothetical protein
MASTVVDGSSVGASISGTENVQSSSTNVNGGPAAATTNNLNAPQPSSPAAPVTPTAAGPIVVVLQPVTNIAVTYMTVGPNDNYIRFGRTTTPSYLWLDRTPGPLPINGISVQWGAATPAGDGWTRVDNDLNNGSTPADKAVFLWIKRGGAESPLVDLKVVTSDDPV